jgi:hypothetical protein
MSHRSVSNSRLPNGIRSGWIRSKSLPLCPQQVLRGRLRCAADSSAIRVDWPRLLFFLSSQRLSQRLRRRDSGEVQLNPTASQFACAEGQVLYYISIDPGNEKQLKDLTTSRKAIAATAICLAASLSFAAAQKQSQKPVQDAPERNSKVKPVTTTVTPLIAKTGVWQMWHGPGFHRRWRRP